MSLVALIDYGSGNLRSAEKALALAAADMTPAAKVVATADPDIVSRADAVVLPGVGAFAACLNSLKSMNGLLAAITHAARVRAAPFLGICVGMQLMADRGLEFGETAGFGWIGGVVRRLSPAPPAVRVPHMGWNDFDGAAEGLLFAGLGRDANFYFTHSFAFFPDCPADVAAWTSHGERFAAAVTRGNLAGVQFHPEKSQAAGARFLANFLAWRP